MFYFFFVFAFNFRTDPTKNVHSPSAKTAATRLVLNNHLNADEVENASQKLHSAMERRNVLTEKTKRIAISESHDVVQPTHSHVDRASVCQSTSSATQLSRVAMAAMNRRTYADRRLWSATRSKDFRALRQHAATATVRWNAVTVVAGAQRLFVRDEMDAAMEATSEVARCAVSWTNWFEFEVF